MLLVLGVSIGAIILAAGALYLLHNYGDFFSYNGLTKRQVLDVKSRLEKHYDLLSSVSGKTLFGDKFYRGIYINKNGGYPLYYRLELKKNGGASFSLYPMLTELWSTNPNILGTKAR